MKGGKFRAVLLFGAPGVGKGTQGRTLGQLPGLFHLSTGEIFRSLDPDSSEAREVAGYTSRGELVPDELTIRIVRNAFDREIAAGRFHPDEEVLLLDGIPRNVRQAELFDETVEVLCILYLAGSDREAMVRRLKQRALQEGRTDDADEAVIRHRFEVYRRDTEPMLRYYPDNLIAHIDALPTPLEVLRDIADHLIPALKRQTAAKTE